MTTRFLCVFLLSVNLSYGQGYDTSGDEEFIKNIPKKTQTQGFVTAAYPESYDLTKYMPPIGDQGRSGSCVAWTLSYYSMSMLYNRHFGVSDKTAKMALAFDPYYFYNSRFGNNYSIKQLCESGMTWLQAFNHAEETGNKRQALPPHDLSCQYGYDRDEFRETFYNSLRYKIRAAFYLDPEDYTYIDDIKFEIYNEKNPVPIAISYYGDGLRKAGNNGGYFQPNYTPNERAGHAMTIVGYDDFVNGGSVLVANSWGTQWGNRGFLWIKYKDLRRYAHITVAVEPRFYGQSIRDKKNYKHGMGEFGRYTYSNGDFYEGEMIDTKINGTTGWKRNGYGIQYFKKSNTYYIGKWKYDPTTHKSTEEGGFIRIRDNAIAELFFQNGKAIKITPSWTLGFAGTKKAKSGGVKEYFETKFKGSGFVWEEDNQND
tara:strand:+ start:477 stop:1760 length:1284 start_codon:yes stop_codon:yes gene_type:complete